MSISPAVSSNGDWPNNVSATDEPDGSEAAAALVRDTGGCAAATSGGSDDGELHGFICGNSMATGALATTVSAVVIMAAPQYVPPNTDAASGAVETVCGSPIGVLASCAYQLLRGHLNRRRRAVLDLHHRANTHGTRHLHDQQAKVPITRAPRTRPSLRVARAA